LVEEIAGIPVVVEIEEFINIAAIATRIEEFVDIAVVVVRTEGSAIVASIAAVNLGVESIGSCFADYSF